jgi:hypothetical protein
MMQEIEKSSLRSLFWKDEILQVLYWMNGEGLGSQVRIAEVLALLNTNEANLLYQITKLIAEDVLISSTTEINRDTKIELSSEYKREAGRRFADAFQGYQKAGHGECGPDCEFCYGPDGTKLDDCVHNCASAN